MEKTLLNGPNAIKIERKKIQKPWEAELEQFWYFFFYQFWGNVIMNVKLILKPYFKKALIFLTLIDLELTKLPETVQMETFISSEIILELWKGLV